MNKRRKTICALAGLTAASWLPAATYAQEAAADQSLSGAIEEVLVTARRREESLQEVPIAISAFGGEDLAQRGVQNVGNMNAMAPNLSVMGGGNSGESQASFRVRGIPGVAVYIDGVNQAANGNAIDGLLTMSVVEVDRMEVLRGPQGTLFGNSSLGGAVHYITRAPADTFGARIEGSIGSFNRRDFQAAVDLPLSDTFKTKFTLASQTRDGFVNSVVTDRAYGDINDELARADFLWTPTDSLSFRYNVEKTATDRAGPARVVWEIGATDNFQVGAITYNTNPTTQAYENIGVAYNTFNNASGQGGLLGKYDTKIGWETDGLVIDIMRHTFDADWNINDALRVRAISGYKELTRGVQVDFDGAQEVMILERDNRSRTYAFSEELQLLGTHEQFDWVLGAYYSRENNRNRTTTWSLPEFTCDLWNANNRQRVTAAEQATCRANRAAALGLSSTATNAQLAAANLNGVTNSTFSGAAGANGDQMTIQKPKTQAVFGDITFRVTDQFSLAAGVRYSEDENDGTITLNNNTTLASRGTWLPDNNINDYFGFNSAALPAPTGATKFDALTKRLTLQYQWNPDLMTYIGYSDGYQPGDASNTASSILNYMATLENGLTSDIPTTVFRDEQTVKNYEVGLRADWLGGAFRTNLTAFFTDWKNVPVSQYIATRYWDTDGDNQPDSTIDVDGVPGDDIYYFPNLWTVAVAKAEAKGIEFEAQWLATDSLRFNLNLGWLDTAYKELGQAGEGNVPAVSTGSQFQGAPEYTGNLSATYEYALSSGAAILPRIDYTYTDAYTLQTGDALQRTQEGFGLLNARIAYDSGNNWTVALSGTNLTDEYYFNSGFFTRAEQIHFMTIGRPREWGLTFNWTFE